MIPKQVIEKIIETKSQSKAAKATGSARTKARKARRELAKVAAQPVVPKVEMIKMSRRPHHALLGARASAKLETEEARRYFDSLIVPESGSAQFPDLSDFPTVPVSSRYFFTQTPIADSVTGKYFSVVAFFPNLDNAYCVPTGIASGVITWGDPAPHPRYTSYVANFANYRTISMGAHVINSTNLNQKVGLFFQDLISESTASRANLMKNNLPTTLQTITASPTVKAGAFSNEYLEDVPRATWLPSKLNQMEFVAMDANTDTDVYVATYPALLFFCDHQTTSVDYAQNLTFEIFYNFEAVPLYSTATLFNPTMCVGSPESIAKGLLENRNTMLEGVNATLKDFQKRVGTIAEYSRATSQLMGELGSLASVSGLRAGVRKNDTELNRLAVVMKDLIPSHIDVCSSERKDLGAFLECVKTLKKLLSDPDFPRHLVSEPSYRKSGPWKQELISVEVSDSLDDSEYQMLSAPPPSLKPLKTLR